MYPTYIQHNYFHSFSKNFLAGLVTAIALLPEVTGFAIIAGIPPLSAIFSSAITVIVLSLFGGRPAMVSAAAGSIALLLTDIIAKHGMGYMILASLLAGVIQVLFGVLNVHKLVKFIPKSVMQGFVNALAIMILLSQLKQIPHQSLPALCMIIVSIGAMYLLPKWFVRIPPALIIMISSILIAFLFKGTFENIGSLAPATSINIHFGFPSIPLNISTFLVILPTALGIAIVGLIESLLTVPLIDNITKTKSDSKKEAIGQGIGNMMTGLFGGQGGCAMIGQSVMNVQSGGKNRTSTLTCGLLLLILVFSMKNLMLAIPTASLIGIMITVSIATFDWKSVSWNKNTKIADLITMITTIVVVICTHNLALGVFSGLISATLFRYLFNIKLS